MSDLKDNRFVRTFAELRSAGRKTLMPFLTAGYPDLQTTGAILADLEARGVLICEIGFPFSDPIADGPTIQASYTEALDAGVNTDGVFRMIRRYRDGGGEMALTAMVSYSIVYRHGVKVFVTAAADAGFDGLIIPDLPLGACDALEPLAASRGMCNVLLIAPTTAPERRLKIARASRGFIYYMSVAGITGERVELPPETIAAVAEFREHTDTPVCVGFGISNPQTVEAVCKVADGAIVGSAIIHRITDAMEKQLSREQLVEKVGAFVSDLLKPISRGRP